jgi:GGDEF domain-containing protein
VRHSDDLLDAAAAARRAPAASIGIATFGARTGADRIPADADLAMYEAKGAGGDRSAHWAAAQSASSTR